MKQTVGRITRLGGPDDVICNAHRDKYRQEGIDRIVKEAQKIMLESKEPKVGDAVIYVDSSGNDFNAIVITVWQNKMINCVTIEDDETRTDSYGRQIRRPTSIAHISNSPVHGMHWRWAEEEKAPIAQPIAT